MAALLADEVTDTGYGHSTSYRRLTAGFDGDVDQFFANKVKRAGRRF